MYFGHFINFNTHTMDSNQIAPMGANTGRRSKGISVLSKTYKSYKGLETGVGGGFNRISKLLTLFVGFLVIYNTIVTLFDKSFHIQPIDVPQRFVQNGITNDYTSLLLADEISRIREDGWSINGLTIQRRETVEIEQDIVIFGVSFNALKSLTRNLFRIKDKAIKGSIVIREDELKARINIPSGENIMLTQPIAESKNLFYAYDELIEKTSLAILREVDPFILASYYWAIKDQEASITIIKEMVERQTTDLDHAYLLWGEICANNSEYEKALQKFEESVAINSDNALSWNAWGMVLYDMGNRDDEAILKFKEAIDLDKEFWHAWFHWSLILDRNGQSEEAISKMLKAIEIDNTRHEAYNELSYFYMNMGELDKSVSILKQGIENNPTDAILYATLSEMYWEQGEKEEAFESLDKAIELDFNIDEYLEYEPYQSYKNR